MRKNSTHKKRGATHVGADAGTACIEKAGACFLPLRRRPYYVIENGVFKGTTEQLNSSQSFVFW